MKKNLFITIGVAAAIFTTLFFTEKNQSALTSPESTVNKNVTFAVYKSSDYSSSAYNNTLAQLHVTIEKTNAAGENSVVWEKTFDSKYLNQYPSVEDAIKQNIEISNMLKKNEYLVVKYDIVYNSQGSELQMRNDIIINNSSENISISI